MVQIGVKNYVLVRRNDPVSILAGTSAISYLAANGIQALSIVWVNVTSTDTADILTPLRSAVNQIFSQVDETDVSLLT